MEMKTFLFYDTETTGLAKMNKPVESPFQPRVVQIAALLTNENGLELDLLNEYLIPVGFTIPDEVVAIHGTTTEKATALGKNAKEVMERFVSMAEVASVHVAHNIAFDRIVVRHECYKQELKMPDRPEMCTMLAMTDKCKIPHPKYRNKIKWPKLQEAYKWCFKKEFDKAHDAMADIRACKDVFFHSVYTRTPCGSINPAPTPILVDELPSVDNYQYLQTR
jgi:DNA polymerase-3 subunit epsilon